MFKKIVVPLDGSEMAMKILPQVEELAKCLQSELVLLHVCYIPPVTEAAVMPSEVQKEAESKELKECSVFLGEVAKDLQGKGLSVKTECVQGVPAREIIAYAETHKMDLIAMATHGKGEVAWILGSTAEKVVTHATVPVLLFRVMEIKPPLFKDIGMP